jgi:hypothetical protein
VHPTALLARFRPDLTGGLPEPERYSRRHDDEVQFYAFDILASDGEPVS